MTAEQIRQRYAARLEKAKLIRRVFVDTTNWGEWSKRNKGWSAYNAEKKAATEEMKAALAGLAGKV